jgi:mono/diheme cytochrome c family protein
MSVSKLAWIAGPLAVALGTIALTSKVETRRGPSQEPDTAAVTPDVIDAGRRIFSGRGTCYACHGPHLEGGPVAPTLRAHTWKDAKGGDLGAIYYIDTHGVPGTVMVAHPGGISDADAVRVASFVWAVSHRGAKP